MNADERIPRWLEDLETTLATAAELVVRGREVFDADPAVSLAFEALSNRVGDLAKRFLATDAERFSDPIRSDPIRSDLAAGRSPPHAIAPSVLASSKE